MCRLNKCTLLRKNKNLKKKLMKFYDFKIFLQTY